MKHLISLSFKYIRRQKLRSVLTFLCIMLAVFIFNTYTAYLGSTIATLINFEKYYNSSHHVDLTGLMVYCDDKEEAAQIIANHAAVEEHFFQNVQSIGGSISRDENGMITYFTVEFDNGRTARANHIYSREVSGNPALAVSQEDIERNPQYFRQDNDFPENAGIFPYWVKELGYREGDEITMTITPVQGRLSEDSPQVKEAREWVKENSTGQYFYGIFDDPEPETVPESANLVNSGSLMSYLFLNYTMDEIEFCDEYYGNPCTFTMTIAGFEEKNTIQYMGFSDVTPVGDTVSLDIMTNPVNCFYIEEIVGEANLEFCERTGMILSSWADAYARISENVDFDDGVAMLRQDLGLEEKHYYDIVFNETLLAYEMRSANAITSIMPLIAAVLLLALVAWFICRFVIDNAFEISVQERSAQFATLRIMGASRAQLVALIFTEAIFYCLTAVPIGVLAAFGACKMVMELLGGNLFPIFAFDVNPWITVIGIIISLSGILISAYTSAMWAARKLSPMEALQYGKPRKKARKEKQRKSVLKRKSFGFVLDYTMKNISHTKSRYVISTIAMALGIVMFSFCVLGVNLVNSMSQQLSARGDVYDYELVSFGYAPESQKLARELFRENDAIRSYSEFTVGIVYSQDIEADFEKIAGMQPYEYSFTDYHTLGIVDRSTYEELLEPVSGISYEDFAAGGGMIYISSGGSVKEEAFSETTGLMERRVEDGYWTWEEKGFAEQPVITLDTGLEIPLMGAVCVDYNLIYANRGMILIAADAPLDQNLLTNLYTTIHLTVNGHQYYEEAKDLIDEFTASQTGFYVVDYYMENTGLFSFANTIFRTLSVFLISVWLVGILTMVNSINTSVLNRQKELLMLRSVGMTKKQLQRSVMLEGVIYCILSTIIGLLIGIVGYCVLLEYIVWQETGLNATQTYVLPIFLTSAGTILLNLIIAVLAAVPALDSLSKRMR